MNRLIDGNSQSLLSYATGIGYAPHGAVKSINLANGIAESTAFNSRLQPSSIRAEIGATNVLTLGYTYGAQAQANNGNLQTQTISFAAIGGAPAFNEVQTYASYDALNRLVTAQTAAWTQTNGYDRYGNRWVQDQVNLPSLTQQTPRTDTWFTQKNRIKYHETNPPPDAWQYDGVGNLTGIPSMGRSFVYDGENRQTAATVNSVTTQYAYDGDGRRVKRVIGNDTTVFVYDAAGALAAEYGGTVEAGRSYVTVDHLGSTRLLTDGSGGVKRRYDYLPFGEEIPAGTGGRTVAMGYGDGPSLLLPDKVSQKFTGKERDAETGLDYFLARYYSGAQGRFTSPDPKTFPSRNDDPQSWNKYGYARNNPLRYTDPDGEEWQDAKIGPLADGPASTRLRDVAIGAAKGIGKGGLSMLRAMGADAHLMDEADRALMPSNARQEMVMKLTEFGMEVESGRSLATAGVFLVKHPMAVGQAFKSFDALKGALGSAGEGMAWHHIVEQSKAGEFGASAIHNTANVVRVSKEVNSEINAYYSSKQAFTNGKTVRQWLTGKSWEEQYKFGREILTKAQKGELR